MEVRESPADARRSELTRFRRGFPGQAQVGSERPGGGQLGEGRDRQPGPAVGGFGVADLGDGPTQGLLHEPERVLDVEAAQPCRPQTVEEFVVDAARGGPEPDRFGRAGVRQSFGVDADHGALDDRQRLVVVDPGRPLLEPGMQTLPCLRFELPVSVGVGDRDDMGCAPGRGVGQAEHRSVPLGPPDTCIGWRSPVEHSVGAEPADHDYRQVTQLIGQAGTS